MIGGWREKGEIKKDFALGRLASDEPLTGKEEEVP